jgi:hypothetical protein
MNSAGGMNVMRWSGFSEMRHLLSASADGAAAPAPLWKEALLQFLRRK